MSRASIASTEQTLDEKRPQIPPSIPPDEFFGKLTERQRLEHLQDSLYQAALVRRQYRQNGLEEKVAYQSNYRSLLAVMEGVGQAKPAVGGRMGAIMAALKANPSLKTEGSIGGAVSGTFQSDQDLDEGLDGTATTSAPVHVSLAREDRLGLERFERSLPRSTVAQQQGKARMLGDQLVKQMTTGPSRTVAPVPQDVLNGVRCAAATLVHKDVVDDAETNHTLSKAIGYTMKLAVQDVRKKHLRCSSYPRAIYSVGAYHDVQEKYETARLEMKRMKAVCDGKGPREQERKLQKKLEALESQVVNQLALIKGLREKIKIMREQQYLGGAAGPVPISNAQADMQTSPFGSVMSVPTMNLPISQQQLAGRRGNTPVLGPHTPLLQQSASQQADGAGHSGMMLNHSFSQAAALSNNSFAGLPSALQPPPGQQHDQQPPSSASSIFKPSTPQERTATLRQLMSLTPPGPRGDQCTVLLVDLDSSAYLWETYADTMKTQAAVFTRTLRALLPRWRGYEALNKEEKFLFAFYNPMDACQFALEAQSNLLSADWSGTLSEIPEAATEYLSGNATKYLWRGLRARMGMEMGANAVIDPIWPDRTSYEGPAVEVADYLQKIAMGGEILISGSVLGVIGDGQLRSLGNPIVEPLGSLTYHTSRAAVRRITSKQLEERLPAFNRSLQTSERTLFEEADDPELNLHPPSGNVTMVTVLSPYFPLLKMNVSDECYKDTMQRTYHCITSMCRAESGYISQLNVESMAFVIVFDDVLSAIKFSIEVQKQLVEQRWKEELLKVPQFSTVRVREELIFQGARVQIGIFTVSQQPQTYREPMENKLQYRSNDARLSSLIAATAVDGEIMLTDAHLPYLMDYYDELSAPVSDYVTEISTPAADTLLRVYHVFPEKLRLRAPFVNRELRLADESVELSHADLINSFRQQAQAMQSKLQEKNRWIERLYDQIEEKTTCIQSIRQYVLKTPFLDIDVGKTVLEHDKGYTFPNDVIMVGLGFANADELYKVCPADTADAVDIYNDFLDRTLVKFEGREVRRLPSRLVRLVVFPDIQRAASFFMHVTIASMEEDWPTKLDETSHAGLVMASEYYPGLQPDVVVWKGLRPTCAIHYAHANPRFNTLTKAYEVVGEDVNVIAEMLRTAGPGDCLMSARCATQFRDRLEKTMQDLQVNEYGPYFRVIDVRMRYRNRSINQTFMPYDKIAIPVVQTLPPVLAVQVSIQDTMPLSALFAAHPEDVEAFNRAVLDCTSDFGGKLKGSFQSSFLIFFWEIESGCRFAVHLHNYLLRTKWSQDLCRQRDFRDLHMGGHLILRGIRAKVGCQVISEVSEILDLLSAETTVFHPTLNVVFALAQNAHAGETIVTEATMDYLRRAQKDAKVDYFSEPCGNMTAVMAPPNPDKEGKESPASSPASSPTGTRSLQGMFGAMRKFSSIRRREAIYQVFPQELKTRVAFFIDEDKRLNDPNQRASREKKDRAEFERRERQAQRIEKDKSFLMNCKKDMNPFLDPVHKKTASLFRSIRPQLDEERSRFLTCQKTLELLETVNMMAEDQLFLGSPDLGVPYFAHLLLHEMENGQAANDWFFKKELCLALLGGSVLPEPPKTITETAPRRPGSEGDEANGGSGSRIASAGTAPSVGNFGMMMQSEASVAGLRNTLTTPIAGDRPSSSTLASHLTGVFRSAAPSGPQVASVFTTNFRVSAIQPEDVVQLHIDVERFLNLLKLHGADDPLSFVEAFTRSAAPLVLPHVKDIDALILDDLEPAWKAILDQSAMVGMDVSNVDMHKLRCSILANLAQSFLELVPVDFSQLEEHRALLAEQKRLEEVSFRIT